MTESADTAADLAADTRVVSLSAAPGWYTADLPDHWNFRTPSGGVLMTVALRAMQEELGDASFRPVSATTVFCSPVPEGPVEIRVEVLRRGNAATQLRAALSSTALPGPGLEVSATFARDRSFAELDEAPFPDVPMPADAPSAVDDAPHNPHTRAKFFRNIDARVAHGERWWSGEWQGGPTARYARWMRYKQPQRLADGTLDPFCLPPLADTMPAAVVQGLGPSIDWFIAPSLDLTVHFLEPTTSEWLLVSAYSRRARNGNATAEVEIWSEDKKLIAYGNQMMMLRKWPRRNKLTTE